ncbi:MAG: SDR family NAD(P)-dependent oxidoreductase [Nannocystales bacterium]
MQGREVLITGAGGGLGIEVTAAALQAGARVTAPTHGTDAETLRRRFGDEPALRCVDASMTDLADVERVVASMPRVDAVLHLVGGFTMGAAHEVDGDTVGHMLALNVSSTIFVLRTALARMRADGYGRIVTVASRNALEPGAQTALYGACKAAVLNYTQAIAEETRELDITANSVLPSIIDTPANRAAMGTEHTDLWVNAASLAKTIIRLGQAASRDLRGTAVKVYGRV